MSIAAPAIATAVSCTMAGWRDRSSCCGAPCIPGTLERETNVHDYQREFIELTLARDVLRFGEFTLKSGRVSPYFFNMGRIDSGAALARLGRSYAEAATRSGVPFDMLFGPAYKGIALAAATAIALADSQDRDLPWAYNRKEAKAHGEGGTLVRASLKG